MSVKTLGLLIAGLLLAMACGKKTEESANPQSPMFSAAAPPSVQTKTRTSTETPSGAFGAEVEALPEPNNYRVRLHWPALSHSETWIVQRSDEKGLLKTVGRFDGDVTETVDNGVTPGAKYRYELSASEQSSWHRTDKLEIAIPQDTEIRGTVDTNGIQTNRLYLRAGSVLRIGERQVQIVADEIFAEGGVIETYAEGQTAPVGRPGRNGGHLTIQARAGHGVLSVRLRGENGGAGVDGAIGSAGARGADGTNGETRIANVDLLAQLTSSPINLAGRVVMMHNKPDPADSDPVWKAIEACTRPPQPGVPGALGGPGQNGIAGGAGGNAGELLVTIESAQGMQVLPELVGGHGGVGRGGEGGPRGANGSDGKLDKHQVCPPAVSLPSGTGSGPRGQDASGAEGAAGSYCLHLSGAKYGNCGLN